MLLVIVIGGSGIGSSGALDGKIYSQVYWTIRSNQVPLCGQPFLSGLSMYCIVTLLKFLLYCSVMQVSTVLYPCSGFYCVVPLFRFLLCCTLVPVSTVFYPCSGFYCVVPLYDSLVQVSTVLYTCIVALYMFPNMATSLYQHCWYSCTWMAFYEFH